MFVAEAAGRAQAGPWYPRAGRTAGAGLTGAAVGAGVAGIWRAGWEAAGGACRGAGDVFCIPVTQAAAAVVGSGLLICVGVSLGFFLIQVRPKRLTIPVGCVLAAMLIWAVGVGIPGGTPPPAWTTALAVGAGLASLALMVDSGRAQIAGFVAIAVVLASAFTLPRLIQSRIKQDARERQLAALGFPLMLPVASGYHASGDGAEVITWRGDLEVDAMSLGYSPVSPNALVEAATNLRPASAAALAGLGP